MKILVLGAGGMLGKDLASSLEECHSVLARDHAQCDILDRQGVREELRNTCPNWVVNAAAYADVDECESKKELAFAVNGEGARNVALACAEWGARLVHLSTDYVFDGCSAVPYREEDPPHPINVYGASKLQGERYVRQILEDPLIVRTAWLYGRHGRNFVEAIRRRAAAGEELRVVDDQRGSPTFTKDLSRAIARLLELKARGIFHVTNSGSCTWFEFARRILRTAPDGPEVPVLPISSAELARPARRPANSILDCRRFEERSGWKMRLWPEALGDYLSQEPPVFRPSKSSVRRS